MRKPAIMALDFGSQSAKTLVFDYHGSLITTASAGYPWLHPEDGFIEIEPAVAFAAAEQTVGACIAKVKDEYEIKALSFSYFGHGMLLVDKDYNPTSNIILLADTRSANLLPEIQASGADKVQMKISRGSSFNPNGMPAKTVWFKKYRPDVFEKTAYLFDIQQYLLAKLGLEPVNDGSMAICKDVLDVNTGTWSMEAAAAFGMPESWLSTKVVGADYIAGTITRFGSVDLCSNVLVMPGGHDTECGVLGMGAIPENPGILSDSMGTYHQCGFFSNHSDGSMPETGMASFMTKGGKYKAHMNSTSNGGSTMSWFIRTFCGGEPIYDDLFAAAKFDASTPSFFCPLFSHKKATIGQMMLSRTREQLFESLIEGITFELAGGYEKIHTRMNKYYGCDIKEIRAMGGGSQADKFLQLRATVFGIPVVRSNHIQGTGAGAAMIAAVGAGAYKDYKEASDHMVVLTDRFEPDLKLREAYLEKLANYISWRDTL